MERPERRGGTAWLGAALVAASLATPATGADAVIWYLGHCGYVVETANHVLIFDYIELEERPTVRGLARGFVDTAEIAGRTVTAFVTHSHVDHFDRVVFTWRDHVERIRYVLGWDGEQGADVHRMGGRGALELDGMKIHTVSSHHAGVPEVGYLVQVDGLTLFHAGDYQGRPDRGSPSNAVADMRWLREQAPRVDLLFLGAWTGDPYLDVIRGLEPATILAMHWRKQEVKYREFAAELKRLGFTQPVVCPTRRGDRFELRDGSVAPALAAPAR